MFGLLTNQNLRRVHFCLVHDRKLFLRRNEFLLLPENDAIFGPTI